MLAKLKDIKLQPLNCIKFIGIEKASLTVKQFLKSNLPETIKKLHLSASMDAEETKDKSIGLYDLENCLLKVTDELKLCNLSLSKNDLELLLKHSAHLKKLKLVFCQLSISESINISTITKSNLTHLELIGCREESHEWGDGEELAKNMINGIANSSLKDSLTSLSMIKCGVDEETLRSIAASNGKLYSISITYLILC